MKTTFAFAFIYVCFLWIVCGCLEWSAMQLSHDERRSVAIFFGTSLSKLSTCVMQKRMWLQRAHIVKPGHVRVEASNNIISLLKKACVMVRNPKLPHNPLKKGKKGDFIGCSKLRSVACVAGVQRL